MITISDALLAEVGYWISNVIIFLWLSLIVVLLIRLIILIVGIIRWVILRINSIRTGVND